MAVYIASETHKESEHDIRVKEVESFRSTLKDVTFYSSCFKGGTHRSFVIIHAHSMDEAKSGVPEMFKKSLVEVEEMDWGPEGGE
jgi:hypothetical protein